MGRIVVMSLPSQYSYLRGYVILPMTVGPMKEQIQIDGETLYVKPEQRVHMSILSVKKYAPMIAEHRGIALEDAEKLILETSAELLNMHPISFDEFTGDYLLAEEEEKKTIVRMCQASGINEFFDGLRKKFDVDIPNQPTHVTLYTREGGVGIGLTSEDDIKALTRKLSPEEKDLVIAAVNV